MSDPTHAKHALGNANAASCPKNTELAVIHILAGAAA